MTRIRTQVRHQLRDFSQVIGWLINSRYGIVIPVGAATAVALTYVLTHQYPARLGGLFLLMGETILANNYVIPPTIPQTAPNIPFAYPPIGPYILAVLLDVGINWRTATLVYPAFLHIAQVIPAYLFAATVFSRRHAVLFATAVVTNPIIYLMTISAGGPVRGLAALFLFFGLYSGVRLFRDHDSHHLILGGVLFGLTVMTHLYYAVFFGLSYLAFFAYFDRSRLGLLRGILVATLGGILSLVWIIPVVQMHGADVFLAASGRKTGIGPDLGSLGALLYLTPVEMDYIAVWAPLGLLGLCYLVVARRWFVPAWYALTAIGFSSFRFLGLIYSLGASILLSERLEKILPEREIAVTPVILIVLIGFATGGSVLYAAEYPGPLSTYGDTRLTDTLSDEDVEALEWLDSHSEDGVTIMAQGLTAEWVPYLSDTRLVSGRWGLEFSDPEMVRAFSQRHQSLNNCKYPDCIAETLQPMDDSADFIYLQKPAPAEDYRRSKRFSVAFENEGVIIVTWNEAQKQPIHTEHD